MSRDEIGIPLDYFDRVLDATHDLSELKAVLQVIRLAAERPFPAIPQSDLLSGPTARLVAGLDSPVPAEERLLHSLGRAVSDGLLMRIDAAPAAPLYMPNTTENVELLRSTDFDQVETTPPLAPETEIVVHRPNVYALYEQHLGPLTPLLAEQLRDAERMYPRAWIEGAILQAVHYNKRNWRYVQAILANWEETGAPDGIAG
ncbi:MAG TPA: DnaD domain protein [Chloroflexota bacterium]|nr:DnaD domain protein [Chloroflexota bacterium]